MIVRDFFFAAQDVQSLLPDMDDFITGGYDLSRNSSRIFMSNGIYVDVSFNQPSPGTYILQSISYRLPDETLFARLSGINTPIDNLSNGATLITSGELSRYSNLNDIFIVADWTRPGGEDDPINNLGSREGDFAGGVDTMVFNEDNLPKDIERVGEFDFVLISQSGSEILLRNLERINFDGCIFDARTEQSLSDCAIGFGLNEGEAQELALLYEAGLNRNGAIDKRGLNYWIDVREDGAPLRAIAQSFLNSNEFTRAFGDVDTLTGTEFVQQLYLNVLDREGEPRGVSFWTRELDLPNVTRADVLISFARSAENVANSPFVEDLIEIAPGEWDFVG